MLACSAELPPVSTSPDGGRGADVPEPPPSDIPLAPDEPTATAPALAPTSGGGVGGPPGGGGGGGSPPAALAAPPCIPAHPATAVCTAAAATPATVNMVLPTSPDTT